MRIRERKKVFVAMSGGVDSSVAALILKNQGYDVVGVFMRCWSQGSSDALGVGASCSTEQDAEDARRVAGHLGIPFYVWDFEEEYKKRVVDYMIEGYRKGITPNPDVMCNKEIKFGLFLEKALAAGADYVATGHYVRLNRTAPRKQHNFLPAPKGPLGARKFASPSARHSDRGSETKLAGLRDVPQGNSVSPLFSLCAAKDKNKDQSYFLWTLTQEQLKHCFFPIGDYLKPEVRAIARKAGLPTADKKDSQGICFLGKVTLADFLKQYIPEKHGAVLTTAGEKVGEHPGAEFFTIGQRHGLGIGGGKALYVAEKETKTNTLVVAEGNENPVLYRKKITLAGVNFIGGNINFAIAKLMLPVLARIRYRQPLARAVLYVGGSPSIRSGFRLVFDKPQKFVAPGQSAVFYKISGPAFAKASVGMEMFGGGVIT